MSKAPNILLFMVDELRYPTVYDNAELKAWMAENLVAQRLFRERGLEFQGSVVINVPEGSQDPALTASPPPA